MTTTTAELLGHTSPETAYLIPDYPYGFRLRTEIRYWIETKVGHGQRVMSQTRNPKRAGAPWNKPKGSTYLPVQVLTLNAENGHVEIHGLSPYAGEAEIAEFCVRFPQTAAEPRNAGAIDVMLAHSRACKRVTWTIPEAGSAPRQSAAEQIQIIRKYTHLELAKLRAERDGEKGGE